MNQYKNKKRLTKFYNRAAKLIFSNGNRQELLRKVSELSPGLLAKREEFECPFCIAVKSAPIQTSLLFRPDPKVCPKIMASFQLRSTDGAIKRQFKFKPMLPKEEKMSASKSADLNLQKDGSKSDSDSSID